MDNNLVLEAWITLLCNALFGSSKTTSASDLLVGTNNVCEILDQYFLFHMDLVKIIAATGNSRSWLTEM
jgi:hypothetical protein